MLEWAVFKKLIEFNPCKQVKMLSTADKSRIQILTVQETKALFPADWKTVWDDRVFYTLNRLASCTGMRMGELLGLKGDSVFESFIDVKGQYTRFGFGDTKSHKEREIPIHEELRRELEILVRENGAGYVFSHDGGKKPVSRPTVYKALYAAFDKIGIDAEQREERHLSMHGWRHFLNTELVMADVPESKMLDVIGHSSRKVNETYRHIDSKKMTEIIKVQGRLLETAQPDEDGAEIPEQEESLASKLQRLETAKAPGNDDIRQRP
jgi:integrase